jgi:lysozyme
MNKLFRLFQRVPLTERVPGCDSVAHWQGLVNYTVMSGAGARYAYLRAGSVNNVTGELYEDYQWQRNKVEGPKVLPCGAFWYFRPNHDPLAQADYFADCCAGVDLKLGLEADVEVNGGLTPAVFAVKLLQFLSRLYERTGQRAVIYTRGQFWNTYMGRRSEWAQYRLAIARYNLALTGPWSDGKYKPHDWADWTYWQNSADGNHRGAEFGCESDSVCLGVFNGDWAAFAAMFGLLGLSDKAKLDLLWGLHPELWP